MKSNNSSLLLLILDGILVIGLAKGASSIFVVLLLVLLSLTPCCNTFNSLETEGDFINSIKPPSKFPLFTLLLLIIGVISQGK